MKLLEDYILKYGKVLSGNILKVDSFLNHQIDPRLIRALADEIFTLFKDDCITKVLTIEASGIAIAVMAAEELGVDMVFAKKSATKNLSAGLLSTRVKSFTHGREYDVMLAEEFLTKDDRVLVVDDFLADGAAIDGLCALAAQAGAKVVGAAVAIEKGFQDGGRRLRAGGLRLESLVVVDAMSEGGITFRGA